jgi:hypothetical protein
MGNMLTRPRMSSASRTERTFPPSSRLAVPILVRTFSKQMGRSILIGEPEQWRPFRTVGPQIQPCEPAAFSGSGDRRR